MHINHRHLVLLIFAVAALAASAVSYSFFRGFILDEVEESAAIAAEIKAIEEQTLHEQGVTSAYEKSASELTVLNSYIVPQEKVVSLIEEIEKVGTDTGISLELAGIQNDEFTTENGLTFSHFRASVVGTGSWTNVMRALILIEHLPYSVYLDKIRLFEEGQDKDRQWRISFDIKVLTTK